MVNDNMGALRKAYINTVGSDGGEGKRLDPREEIIAQKPRKGGKGLESGGKHGCVRRADAYLGKANTHGGSFGGSWAAVWSICTVRLRERVGQR